ncbi:hypothetical protein [Kocuria sp. CH-021]|uniref:hypothetical protein n=1 Tax=Kocuria sp. CH-021 TaxID=3406735 RepID=UPI003C76724B
MNRWQQVALAVAFVAVVGSGGGGTAMAGDQKFQNGRIYWSTGTYVAATDDGGTDNQRTGAIGRKWSSL